MNRLALLCCAAVVAGCGPSDDSAGNVPGASAISLADIAGEWTVQAFPENGDSALVTMHMTATATTEGWTVAFPGRDPIPARVITVDGDSVVVDFGPYESALREGVMVSTRSVMRFENDQLRGVFVARYQTAEADSMLRGRQRGTREQ